MKYVKMRNDRETEGGAEAKVQPVLVQLRLAPEMAAELREVGAREGRKLPTEIIHRLRLSPRSDADDLWADKLIHSDHQSDIQISRALGGLVAIIASRAERHLQRTGDAAGDRAALLGIVKNATDWVLDSLNADASQDTGDFPISKGITWDLIIALKQPAPTGAAAADLGVNQSPEQQALGRIGAALGLTPRTNQPRPRPSTLRKKGKAT